LERRKALAVAVAPEPNIQAYSYEDRITVSRPQGEMLENTVFLEKIGPQQALAISSDGWKLAGGDANGEVTLWEIATGHFTVKLKKRSPILSLAFSPDGKWLAVGLAKPAGEPTDTVWVYDIRFNGPHHSFGRATAAALVWSSDSRWLAAGLDDGSVVTAIAFHPSGQFLASGHANKRVLIFKFPTGERFYTFEAAVPPNPRFPQVIERVAWPPPMPKASSAFWDTSALLR
jgi:WD40 repeat protein